MLTPLRAGASLILAALAGNFTGANRGIGLALARYFGDAGYAREELIGKNLLQIRLAPAAQWPKIAAVLARNALGHPAQLLVALDDVLAAAQADQRERASGQISFFDMAAEPASLEAPLPAATEVPVRERLRWEKELLGLYLSDHPLGEVAERIGRFVTAYSGELKDETLEDSEDLPDPDVLAQEIVDDFVIKLRIEKSGRGGKTVTVVKGFVGIGLPEKEQLAKAMQKACGTGGTVKDGTIETQGDHRQQIAATLQALGYKTKFTGG